MPADLSNRWSDAERLPGAFQSSLDETQPWVNDEETLIRFTRRGEDANSQMRCSIRPDILSAWNPPWILPTKESADGNGLAVWGKPSFLDGGSMVFVRFDTTAVTWNAELFLAARNDEGNYGPPQKLLFNVEATGGFD